MALADEDFSGGSLVMLTASQAALHWSTVPVAHTFSAFLIASAEVMPCARRRWSDTMRLYRAIPCVQWLELQA